MSWTKNFAKPEGRRGRLLIASMNIGHTPISKWGLAHYAWQTDTAALDIGCGGGVNVRRMLKLAPQGTAAGIDISDECVMQSKRKNLAQLGRRCTIKRGSADAIPFRDGEFDVATAFETVYFWPDLPKAFAEVLRVLKQGGSFLVVCEMCDPNSKWSDFVEGMTVYTPEQIKAQMQAAGFTQIEIDCPNKSKMCVHGKKTV